jgi:hypothetical protein
METVTAIRLCVRPLHFRPEFLNSEKVKVNFLVQLNRLERKEGSQGSLNRKEGSMVNQRKAARIRAESSPSSDEAAELWSQEDQEDSNRFLSRTVHHLMENKPTKVMLQYLPWVTIRAIV